MTCTMNRQGWYCPNCGRVSPRVSEPDAVIRCLHCKQKMMAGEWKWPAPPVPANHWQHDDWACYARQCGRFELEGGEVVISNGA